MVAPSATMTVRERGPEPNSRESSPITTKDRPTHLLLPCPVPRGWQTRRPGNVKLDVVEGETKLTCMEKIQVYFRKEEVDGLRKAASRSGRSVAELARDAIRKVVLKPEAAGPVAIWDGEPKRVH